MTDRFEISMMGELKYFLGFQIKQLEDGTFIRQTKYTFDFLKKFGMDKAKPIKTLMCTNGHLNLDMGGKSVDQKVYRFMIGSLLFRVQIKLVQIKIYPTKFVSQFFEFKSNLYIFLNLH
jgi:hypothetical protein